MIRWKVICKPNEAEYLEHEARKDLRWKRSMQIQLMIKIATSIMIQSRITTIDMKIGR